MGSSFRNFVVLLILTTASVQCQDTIHECTRECVEGEPPKSCHYELHIEHYSTMTKACWDCPLNITDCYRHHCIPGIGKERGLFTINRQLSGPSIQGFRYRFRMISNGNMNCPIQVSVDGHTLQAIASDGNTFEPVEVDSIVISSGERFDFVLNAAQNVDNYWIRFRGLFDCEPEKAHQVAILNYETMPNTEPTGDVTWENGNRPGRILNPINKGSGLGNEISIGELDALNKDDALWSSDPDVKIWLPYDFYMINNLNFHDPDHYPVHLVPGKFKMFTPQINRITLKMPPVPPLSQPSEVDPSIFCNEKTVNNCTEEFCECVYAHMIPIGSLVELIFIDEGYWLMHCHLLYHAENGMGLVFKVGEDSDMPPVPDGFPACRSWIN